MKYKPPRYEVIGPGKYKTLENFKYTDPKTDKDIFIPKGRESDGATKAIDIYGAGWWVHDEICKRPRFVDGTPITAWTAARILSDILKANGRPIRAIYWRWFTFFIGCRETHKQNGWF